MGYSYTRNGGLCCDGCDASDGTVRKRTCPHKVTGSTFRMADGKRHALPWCPAPALCSNCFAKHGGSAGLHERCKVQAQAAQAQHDAEQAQLDAGFHLCVVGYGDHHGDVPTGYVRRGYAGGTPGQRIDLWLDIPKDVDKAAGTRLSFEETSILPGVLVAPPVYA